MKNRKPPEPLITSVTSIVRGAMDTRPFSAEEITQDKREMYDILKEALGKFALSMKNGEVSFNSTLDLERLVKTVLLVMGEPEGKAEETETVTTFMTPLDLEDPDVKSVYERIFSAYNEKNDEAGA